MIWKQLIIIWLYLIHPAIAKISDGDLPVVSIETRFARVSDTDYLDYTLTATSLDSGDDIDVTLNVDTGGNDSR